MIPKILIFCYPYNRRKITNTINLLKERISAFGVDLSDSDFTSSSERNIDNLLATIDRLKTPLIYINSIDELGVSDKDIKTFTSSLLNLGCSIQCETDNI